MHRHRVYAVLSVMLVAASVGCSSSMTPGKLSAVQTVSDKPRAGNVYLLRGWIGVFSHGIDQLTDKLEVAGVRARQYQDDQWSALANTIVKEYEGKKNAEPLILIGHSYGADDVVRIARRLDEKNIPVDLLITLDPVTPPAVPKNVRFAYDLYQSNGLWDKMPWLRGVAMRKADDNPNTLQNVDIRRDRPDLLDGSTDHFNIEKKERIHDEIIKQVMTVCPDRQTWVNRQGGTKLTRVAVKVPDPVTAPATQPVARNPQVPGTPAER